MEDLKAIHPEIKNILPIWKRIQILVEEDEAKYTSEDFFMELPNEDPNKNWRRRKHFATGFVNPTASLINCKADFVFQNEIVRSTKSEEIEAFILKADKTQHLTEFMSEQVSPTLSAYGTVFAVIDKPRIPTANKAEELAFGMPYITVLDPLQVLDFHYDPDGSLSWFRYKTNPGLDRSNPFEFTQQFAGSSFYVTWTKTDYYMHNDKNELVDSFNHKFGIVPVAIQATFVMDSNKTIGKSTFFSSSRYLIMGNNLNSASNNELFKLASAILLMEDQDLTEEATGDEKDSDNETKITRRTSEEANVLRVRDMSKRPEYLVKDSQVVEMADKKAQWYMDLVFENEKSTKSVDSAKSTPASGISKAYSFQDLDGVLARHAQACENFERQILYIVSVMQGIKNAEIEVQYPMDFDILGFHDAIEMIKSLIEIGFSETGIKEAKKRITPEITNAQDMIDQINQEIEGESVDPQNPKKDISETNPDPATPEIPTGAGATDAVVTPQTSLNGAQVTSLLQVITSVTTGQLPRDAAIKIIATAFNIEEGLAGEMMGTVGQGFKPKDLEDPKIAA